MRRVSVAYFACSWRLVGGDRSSNKCLLVPSLTEHNLLKFIQLKPSTILNQRLTVTWSYWWQPWLEFWELWPLDSSLPLSSSADAVRPLRKALLSSLLRKFKGAFVRAVVCNFNRIFSTLGS